MDCNTTRITERDQYNNCLFLKANSEHAEMRWNVLIKRKTWMGCRWSEVQILSPRPDHQRVRKRALFLFPLHVAGEVVCRQMGIPLHHLRRLPDVASIASLTPTADVMVAELPQEKGGSPGVIGKELL